ncbi:hypothetical protein C1645_815124 [Glomus cerebriforme]|uniref:C2H2-type domain-containing protein n=1 Tax=Glomus cerebriforme TaxID=658196 RepID=A0A397TJH6_9GLOM|nr:hypothetical protein C1645_815124 [Glomus cerebriforme]
MLSFKCTFCSRTFSNKTIYSQHVNICQLLLSSSEESNLITNVSNISLDNEGFSSEINKNEINNKNENFLSYNDQNYKNILEELEPEVNTNYSNQVYADLITLVIKHNLSNIMGNTIIKFFNKHSNLNQSPLSKSIQQEHKYMDNMNLSNFQFIEREKAYSEQNTGTWWKNTEKSLSQGSYLLSLILYLDATNIDILEKS